MAETKGEKNAESQHGEEEEEERKEMYGNIMMLFRCK
jgi:hypothetical protein